MMHVICGAPCSGKTTYIKKHAKPGQLIVDADRIAEAIGSGVSHCSKGVCLDAALRVRDTLIEYAKQSQADSWIIHTKPSKSQMKDYQRHGADIVVLDPGIEVCKRRAAQRPEGTIEQIEKWYTEQTTAQQFAECFNQLL